MLKTDYDNRIPYINEKQRVFESRLNDESFESLEEMAKVITGFIDKNGLIWTKDFKPKVERSFKPALETHSSDLLNRNEDPLTSSFISKKWTKVLINKVSEEKRELNLDEMELFENIQKVFSMLMKLHLEHYKRIGMFLNKINMDFIAYKNYEEAVQNLDIFCSNQREKRTSYYKNQLADLIAAARSIRNSDSRDPKEQTEALKEFIEDKYPKGVFKR